MNTALKLVPVQEISKKNSFTQDEKHVSKSDKFVPIRPEWGAEILNEYGYFLKSLNVGRARKQENVAHQTTIATYQNESALAVGDIFPRITLKIPHIYGAIEAFAAFLRLSCLNGNAFRLNETDRTKVKHLGDAVSQFENVVRYLVSQTDAMNDSIREMQARNVTPEQVAEFTKEVARLRLGSLPGETDSNIVAVHFDDLLKVRRPTDAGRDAFTVYQVEQEALMRHGLRYQLQTDTGIQARIARPIQRTRQGDVESVRSVDLNASLWDAAKKILMG